MYKSVVTVVLFAPLVLSITVIDSEVSKTNEEFTGPYPCVSDGVCDCWYGKATTKLNIDCSNRNLTEAPKMMMKNLRINKLDLSGNALRKAPNMARPGYTHVYHLDLSGNHIVNITKNLINDELKVLDLTGNKPTRVDRAALTKLFQLNIVTIGLHYNRYICDCQSMTHLESLRQMWIDRGIKFATCINAHRVISIEALNHQDFCNDETETESSEDFEIDF